MVDFEVFALDRKAHGRSSPLAGVDFSGVRGGAGGAGQCGGVFQRASQALPPHTPPRVFWRIFRNEGFAAEGRGGQGHDAPRSHGRDGESLANGRGLKKPVYPFHPLPCSSS